MKAYTLRGRILATFLSAAVLTNLFIKAPVKAAAEVLTGGTTRAGATELFEGKQDIYTAGETGTGGQTLFNTWYKFTPTVSGNFVIKAYSSAAEGSDTEASIYSANYILNYDYSTDPVQQTPEYEASRSDLGDGYIAVDNGAVNYGGTNPNDFGFSINLTAGTTYLMFIGNYGIDHALTTLYINGPVNSLKSTGAAQDSISLGWTIPEDIGNSNS
ncbi:MAG TPA: hypothetical protein VHO66_09855, partial [Ruminiclostridium sp.]|nr:hypothetical protein [Ruminiclostridium sp.]